MVQLLRAYARHDICWWACPNGEWRFPKTGARLKLLGVRPGAADLMFVIHGVFHGLELKTAKSLWTQKGRMSEDQTQFEEDLIRAGGVYHLAYGFDEAISALVDMEVFRRNVHFKFTSSGVKVLA